MQTERPVRGTRYEDDYVLWADEQAAALAEGRFADLDLVNLADEIGGLSGRDRRELTSRLRVILVHLLKRAYQPERATNSWKRSEITQAGKIEVLLDESPSLRPRIESSLPQAYRLARREAAAETGLDIDTFPQEPPDAILAGLRAVLEEAGIGDERG
ncbi:MAG: hypothetical protein QOI11_3529 [Candidatus Eremiobacteraeota bacterium]|jgi:hypothetical protein|nr:hypothetical protein [Candidatus Eremiobacteraeota bacterium]